jgi:hypothetical protein
LSYALMWIGLAWVRVAMRNGRDPWWGFALVIANKPFLRLFTAAMGGGDEGVLWDLVSPHVGRWMATATVIALSLPPLIICWRALAPRQRGRMFAAAFLLPMLPLLPVPFVDRAIYGAWIAGTQRLPAFFGVPWSVWAGRGRRHRGARARLRPGRAAHPRDRRPRHDALTRSKGP